MAAESVPSVALRAKAVLGQSTCGRRVKMSPACEKLLIHCKCQQCQHKGGGATTQAPGGDRGGVGGVSGVYVRYGIAEQQETGVGTRVHLRVHEAEK